MFLQVCRIMLSGICVRIMTMLRPIRNKYTVACMRVKHNMHQGRPQWPQLWCCSARRGKRQHNIVDMNFVTNKGSPMRQMLMYLKINDCLYEEYVLTRETLATPYPCPATSLWFLVHINDFVCYVCFTYLIVLLGLKEENLLQYKKQPLITHGQPAVATQQSCVALCASPPEGDCCLTASALFFCIHSKVQQFPKWRKLIVYSCD